MNRTPRSAAPEVSVELRSVRLERLVDASPEAVYEAWTTPALMERWMSPAGRAEVTIDLRVGGQLRVDMIEEAVRLVHRGTFVELDPPRRLQFTWASPYTGAAPSLVTVVIEPVLDQVRLVVIHERLPGAVADSHAGGWGAMLDRLAALMAREPNVGEGTA